MKNRFISIKKLETKLIYWYNNIIINKKGDSHGFN